MSPKKHDTDQWVEALLTANPAEIADDGFSKRVLARIKRQERMRLMVLAPFFITAFGLLIGFFPYELFEGVTGTVAASYKIFMPYMVPVGAVIAMFMFSWFSEEVA